MKSVTLFTTIVFMLAMHNSLSARLTLNPQNPKADKNTQTLGEQ